MMFNMFFAEDAEGAEESAVQEDGALEDEPALEEEESITEQDEWELLEPDAQAVRQDTIFYTKINDIENMETQNFALPDVVTNFSIRVFMYDNAGHYGYSVKQLQVRRPFNLSADFPLYILNNEDFAINLIAENNLTVPIIASFNKPTEFSLNMQPNATNDYKLTINASNLPFTIEAYNAGGQLLATLAVKTQVIESGIPITVSRSGLISVNSSQNSSLELTDTLPATLIKDNSNLEVCYVNSAINIILDAIRKLN